MNPKTEEIAVINPGNIPKAGTKVLDSDGWRPPHERKMMINLGAENAVVKSDDWRNNGSPPPDVRMDGPIPERVSTIVWRPIESAPRRYEQEFLLSGPSSYRAPHDRFVVTGFRREGCGDEWYDVCGDRLSDRGWEPDAWSLPPHAYEPPNLVREALDIVRELERAKGNDYRVTDRLKDLIGKLGGI